MHRARRASILIRLWPPRLTPRSRQTMAAMSEKLTTGAADGYERSAARNCKRPSVVWSKPRAPSHGWKAAACRSGSPRPLQKLRWFKTPLGRWLLVAGGRLGHARGGLGLPEVGIGLGPIVGNVAHVRVESEDLLLRRLDACGFEFAEFLHAVGSQGCGEFFVVGKALVDLRQVFASDENQVGSARALPTTKNSPQP